MLLHEKIRQLRIQNGYSRNSFAKAIGTNSTHLYYIESHKRPNPQLASVVRIAKGLGMTMDELLQGTEFDCKG